MNDEKTSEIGENLFNIKDLTRDELRLISRFLISHDIELKEPKVDGLEKLFSLKKDSYQETTKKHHRKPSFNPIKQVGRAIRLLWKKTWTMIQGSRFFARITLNKMKEEQAVTTNSNEQRSKEGISRSDSTTSRTKHTNKYNEVKATGDSLQSPQMTKKSIGAVKESPIYFTRKIRSANEVAQAVNTALTKKVDHPVSKERG